MSQYLKNGKILVFLLGILFFGNKHQAQTQLPECTADVPFFLLDLSASPDLTYTTPEFIRKAGCCSDNDNYVSFYVTLHPDVAMFELVVAPGYADPPGSGNYNIISGGDLNTPGACGTQIPGGAPICISGSGPHKIIYSKPGSNKIKYIFRQIPRPIFPADQSTRIGCSLPLNIYGLNAITMTSINSSTGNTTPGAFNSLLSCTNCSNPSFSPGLGTPAWIDYQICGTPQAAACGIFTSCDTVRLYTFSALNISALPNPATFCTDGLGVLLTATGTGGDGNYSYTWVNSLTDTVSSFNTYTASMAGSYTAQVEDGLISPTCPAAYVSVPVIASDPPIADAGIDQTVCATSPTVFLSGSVINASGGVWSGGTGTFNPNNTSLLTAYTPSSAEINAGSVNLTLTSTGAGGGCTEDTDEMTITFSDTVYANPFADPISCNGEATSAYSNETGGIAPFTYLWSTGQTSSSINVSAGTYTVYVTDQYGCSGTSVVNVTQPTPLILSMSSLNESVDGACDGSATVSISGGNAPYTILWSNLETSVTTTSTLCYGVYTVSVTDNNGCEIEGSVVVNNFTCSTFDVSANGTDVDCHGETNGTASANIVSGGTAPFTYLWNSTPTQSTQTATNLSAGAYTVLVTDDLGCYDIAGVTILQPTIITNTMTHTDVTTIGGSDGTATANPAGGTPGYSYLWIPGAQTTQTAVNLPSAVGGVTYYVDITDSKSCVKSDSVLINQPPCNNLAIGVNKTNVTCNGLSNGSAYIIVANGTPPYSIVWSHGPTNVTSVSGLAAGNYSVTITDQSNCTTFQSFTISQPDPITLSLVPTNITCFGEADGTIDLTVAGGTYPFTYVWMMGGKNVANHEDLVSLVPGTYSVTVTDANGCTAVGSVGISQPTALSATHTKIDNPCHGNSLGSINATTSGGISPYMFSWSGPSGYSSTSQDISGLATGLYELNFTDLNNCEYGPMQVFINQPDSLAALASMSQQVSCTAGNDGAITLVVTGGTLAYSYSWTGPSSFSATTQNISGLIAGTYNITVTDGQGCTASDSETVTTVLDVINPVISCTGNQAVNTSSSTCMYTHSGTAWNATATDNCLVSSITYTLSGATTGTGTNLNGVAFNLGVTTVTWVATDGLGNTNTCFYTVTVTDTQIPTALSCSVIGNQSVSSNVGVCNYTHTGTAWNATAMDNCSIATITYSLSGATSGTGSSLNGVVFNLGVTTVTWTATDGSGNSASCSYTVTVTDNQIPTALNCAAIGNQSVTANIGVCNYTHTGNTWNATASDNCSIATITYSLSGVTSGTGTSLNGVIFNLGVTTVNWTIIDGSGNIATCSYTVTVTDNQIPSLLSCGAAGNQTVNANTGLCTYTHPNNTWNASATDNCSVATVTFNLTGATTGSGTTLSGTVFNLGVTTVTWTATDGSSNTTTCSFTVTVNDAQLPIITSCGSNTNQTVNVDPAQCNFTQTGTAWNATANDNCSVSTLVYTLTGATTGSGTSLQNVDFNLGTTTVTWTATDESGNISSCSFQVLVIDNLLPVITSCGATGNQVVSSNTGVCTYTQGSNAWNATATDNCTVSTLTYTLTGATTGTGTSLNGVVFNSGTTTVIWTAVDNSANSTNCSFTVTVIDTEAPAITTCPSDITVVTDMSECGAIVSWTVPSFTDNCGATITSTHNSGNFFAVGTTQVTYTVTDGAGNVSTCSFSVTVNDTENPSITCPSPIASCDPIVSYLAPITSDNCGVLSVVQLSGLPSGSEFSVGVTSNTYQVTDIHGNVSTCSFTITIHPKPIISLVTTDVTCNGNDNGLIDATVTNGTTPYSYSWSNSANSEDLSNLAPGNYSLVVSDAFFCTATASATISEPNLLLLTAEEDDVNCFNGNDGAIDIDITGGTTPYTYSWDGGETSQDLIGLSSGIYAVMVTDANGCFVSYVADITQPDSLIIQATIQDATCEASNGSIQIQVTGGTTAYEYDWSNGLTTMNMNNVVAGTYNLVVTDNQNCTAQYTGTIESVVNLNALLDVTNPLCYGHSNGDAQVIVLNGNAPYTYLWSNGETTAQIDSLSAGAYSVIVTDVFGCNAVLNIDINQPDSLFADLITSIYGEGYNVSTYNGENGYVNCLVNGGTSEYYYTWSNGETTDGISNLSAGVYTVVVTDQNGCVAYATSRLTQPSMLEMPSGYSPNGDGDNDVFVVRGIDAHPNNEIVVYNRWGNIVYQKANYANEWDGNNVNGGSLPDATYFVILTVFGNENIVLKGYVDLRRN